MEKNTYPNYSVYLQSGGQLKHPYSLRKRVQIFDLTEARAAAARCYIHYRGKFDVLILRYDAPYTATIVEIIHKGA